MFAKQDLHTWAKHIVLACCWQCITFCAPAQTTPTLHFAHLDQHGGLSDPNIRTMLTDSMGFLWIGTANGLNRFDGSQCIRFYDRPEDSVRLRGNMITNIISDKHNNLWIGTQKGLSKYDYQLDSFVYFPFFDNSQGARYYYSYPFYIDKQNKLWVHLAGNNYIYDEQRKQLQFITAYSNGNSFVNKPFYQTLNWYVTHAPKGIFINYIANYQERHVAKFFMSDQDAIGPPSHQEDVYIASDTMILLAGELGLVALNPVSGKYVRYATFGHKNNIVATSIYPYPGSDWLFVGTNGDGLLLFDLKSRRYLRQYSHLGHDPNSLASNHIEHLYIDPQQRLFVALRNKGLAYTHLKQVIFPHLLSKEEAMGLHIDNDVTAICPTGNGEVWCGTNSSGILVYDRDMKQIIKHLFKNQGIKRITSLNKDELLIEFKSNTFAIYHQKRQRSTPSHISSTMKGMGSISMNQVIPGKAGQPTFVCTESGLATLQRQGANVHFAFVNSMNQAMEWPNIQQYIALTDSTYLVQAYYTNLYLFTRRKGVYQMVKEIARTPYNIHGSVLSNNGKLYLATTSGLFSYDIQHEELSESPLITAYCTGMVADAQGDLWITSNNGIHVYSPRKGDMHTFSQSDGLQGPTANIGTIQQLPNGQMIVGGSNGINLFNPLQIRPHHPPFKTLITQVKINDQAYRSSLNTVLNPPLHLKHFENTLTFQLSPVSFQLPGSKKIRYQMLGYDEAPVTVFGSSEIRYAQMPPGTYTLQVSNEENLYTAMLQITISPPYWKTKWFIMLTVLLAIVTIVSCIYWYIHWIKTRQLHQLRLMINSQEEERKRIASDLHDDFGARLSSIKLYIQATARSLPPRYREAYKQTTQFLDQAIIELRNILSNLSPKVLEENGFEAALEELSAHVSRLTALQIEINTDTHSVKLKKVAQYALYRICQELINNTIKHAGARHIFISLIYRDDLIIFLYEDDGCGFTTEDIGRGYGLRNIRTHAQAIRSDIHIDSSPGKGLAVTITIPASALEKKKHKAT